MREVMDIILAFPLTLFSDPNVLVFDTFLHNLDM